MTRAQRNDVRRLPRARSGGPGGKGIQTVSAFMQSGADRATRRNAAKLARRQALASPAQ